MMLAKRKLKREEKKRLEHIQAQYQEKEDKLKEWRHTIPENKRIVTDDVFLGVTSIHHFPLFLDEKQKERIQLAKEKGRHTFGSPNLLFIQSKGRFVSYLTMGEGKTSMMKQEESEMKMKLDGWKQTLPEKNKIQDVTADESNYFLLWLTQKQEDNIQSRVKRMALFIIFE